MLLLAVRLVNGHVIVQTIYYITLFNQSEFYFTNLAADICLPKMEAGLLSQPKWQFYPPKNNRHLVFLSYENS